MHLISSIDIGDEVVCDFCNLSFDDDSQEGGCFLGDWAVCPECTKDIKPVQGEKVEFIVGPFRQAVLRKRNGDNTIKIYSN